MNSARGRSPFTMVFVRCLRTALLPLLLASATVWALAQWSTPTVGEGSGAGAMAPWLELMLLAVSAVCCGVAITFWPTFADRRPGADWIVRVQRGPLAGCGAVVAGTLAAQLVLTIPLMTAMARALGAPAAAAPHWQLHPPEQPLLAPDHPRLTFRASNDLLASAVELRPLAGLPGGALQPSQLVVRGDGNVLSAAEVTFQQSGQMARLTFAARHFATLEIELASGNVPLFFPAGSVIVVGATEYSGTQNGVIAGAACLLPTFVAMALSCLCGAVAALPTVLTVAFAILFLLTIAGIGPVSPAVLHLLRGHWLPSTGIFGASIASLIAGSLAMIVAMLLRSGHRA